MDPTDTITSLAIIVPAVVAILVSLITVVGSVMNNRDSISAKRLEIAYEKQVEAFREIIEWVGKIRYHCSNKQISKHHIEQLKHLHKELFDSYQRQRAFLPDSVEISLAKYLSLIFQYVNKKPDNVLEKMISRQKVLDEKNLEEYNKFYLSLKEQEQIMVEEIHKFLGLQKPSNSSKFFQSNL